MTTKTRIIDGQTFASLSDGSENSIELNSAVVDALAAKSLGLYVLVHETDSDTVLKVGWKHGPDGVNWTDGSGTLFDSSGAVSSGLHEGSSTDVAQKDQILPIVKVQKGTVGSRVELRISVWAITTPF